MAGGLSSVKPVVISLCVTLCLIFFLPQRNTKDITKGHKGKSTNSVLFEKFFVIGFQRPFIHEIEQGKAADIVEVIPVILQ